MLHTKHLNWAWKCLHLACWKSILSSSFLGPRFPPLISTQIFTPFLKWPLEGDTPLTLPLSQPFLPFCLSRSLSHRPAWGRCPLLIDCARLGRRFCRHGFTNCGNCLSALVENEEGLCVAKKRIAKQGTKLDEMTLYLLSASLSLTLTHTPTQVTLEHAHTKTIDTYIQTWTQSRHADWLKGKVKSHWNMFW